MITEYELIKLASKNEEVILRYRNRKLYSRKLSGYVTSEYVLDLIRLKKRFAVVGFESGKDMTYETIRSILAGLIKSGHYTNDEVMGMVVRHIIEGK